MIEYRTGDLFTQPDVEALAHGVNCKGVMGAGIAPLFKNKFPGLYDQYRHWCDTGLLEPGGVFPWLTDTKIVFNLASQDKPGADASLLWLNRSLMKMREMCVTMGVRSVAAPRIGAGIGGLDWETEVKSLYEIMFQGDSKVKLVVVSLPDA